MPDYLNFTTVQFWEADIIFNLLSFSGIIDNNPLSSVSHPSGKLDLLQIIDLDEKLFSRANALAYWTKVRLWGEYLAHQGNLTEEEYSKTSFLVQIKFITEDLQQTQTQTLITN